MSQFDPGPEAAPEPVPHFAPASPPPAAVAPQRGVRLAVFLFVATFLSTILCGGAWAGIDAFADAWGAFRLLAAGEVGAGLHVATAVARAGLPYACGLMLFFLTHEMGHYVACRLYRVESTPPWFIPFPVPGFLGTFGAFIVMRSPIPHRRALFDIGLAGPLAGFVVAVPLIAFGVQHAAPAPPAAALQPGLVFGDPLLLKILAAWLRPTDGANLSADPLIIAGWVALLATAMNLIPAGQLDGGHVAYALAPRWHRAVSLMSGAFLWSLVLTTALRWHEWSSWLVWAIVIALWGRRHPPLIEEREPLGTGRKLLAIAGFAILMLCFMPHPLTVVRAP